MNKRTLVAVVLAGFVVAGCGTFGTPGSGGGGHGRPPPQPCSGNVCQLDVPVTRVTSNGHEQVVIGPVPDLLMAKGNHGLDGKGVRILWHLGNPGYMFKDDGIAFYSDSSASQFSGKGTAGDGAEFHWVDANTDSNSYGYQIKIYDRQSGTWATLDPTIINQR